MVNILAHWEVVLVKVLASLTDKDLDSLSQGPGLESRLHHLPFWKKKKLLS